ncbi:hypothetical protein CCH79_00004778, partial [Gambusia affinis]
DSRGGSRSASPRGSAKSASHSPARSKDGSRRSRSRSRSQSRSKSSSRRRYSRSRSHSRRRRSRSRSRSSDYRRRRSHSRSPMSNRRRHIGNRANPDPSACLGVFGLSLYTTERDLREVFSKYGPLADVNIVYDQQSRRSRVRTPRRPRSVLMVWSLMDAESEWISPSLKELTLQLLESTWDAPHRTMTGAMTEDMIEVMIATMIAMKSESIDRTDADLRLRTTAEVTARDLGPTRH